MPKKTSISTKMSKLNSDIEWFYGEDFSLDQASDKYQKAIILTKEIETDLNNLKNDIELIDQDFTKEV